jgi:hypothetical protein
MAGTLLIAEEEVMAGARGLSLLIALDPSD